MITPAMEEVLEALWIQENEAAPATFDAADRAALRDCEAQHLVTTPETPRLTQAGSDIGRSIVRRHRLAERLLHDVLREHEDHLSAESCRFEHLIQPDIETNICVLLGHPTACPHGKPIPPGDCCRRASEGRIREVAPLCDGKPGSEGSVVYLATRDNGVVQKMMAMGVLPGSTIHLIQRFPSYVFQVGQSQFAVDRPLAEIIFVHWKV